MPQVKYPIDIIKDLVYSYLEHTKGIDEQKLMGQIENIVDDCEELALDIEKGEYSLPDGYERDLHDSFDSRV